MRPGETSRPLWLASFSVEGWYGHGLGASMGGRLSRHCLESAGEGTGLYVQREPFVIHKVQMPNSAGWGGGGRGRSQIAF